MLSWTKSQATFAADDDEQDYLSALMAESPPSPQTTARRPERSAVPEGIQRTTDAAGRPSSDAVPKKVAQETASAKTSLHFDMEEINAQNTSTISYGISLDISSSPYSSISSFASPIVVDENADFTALYTGKAHPPAKTPASTTTPPSDTSLAPPSHETDTTISSAPQPHTHDAIPSHPTTTAYAQQSAGAAPTMRGTASLSRSPVLSSFAAHPLYAQTLNPHAHAPHTSTTTSTT